MPKKKIDDARRATLSRRSALLLAPALLYASGCKKDAEASPSPGAAAVPGQPRFAFVTNNSSKFWNIAEKGLRKAEKDLGIKVEMFRPLKGDVADQQRFLEDILVQNFDGVAISPINPDGDDGHSGQGRRAHPRGVSRLRRGQVQAQELRRHEQRGGGPSRGRRSR